MKRQHGVWPHKREKKINPGSTWSDTFGGVYTRRRSITAHVTAICICIRLLKALFCVFRGNQTHSTLINHGLNCCREERKESQDSFTATGAESGLWSGAQARNLQLKPFEALLGILISKNWKKVWAFLNSDVSINKGNRTHASTADTFWCATRLVRPRLRWRGVLECSQIFCVLPIFSAVPTQKRSFVCSVSKSGTFFFPATPPEFFSVICKDFEAMFFCSYACRSLLQDKTNSVPTMCISRLVFGCHGAFLQEKNTPDVFGHELRSCQCGKVISSEVEIFFSLVPGYFN